MPKNTVIKQGWLKKRPGNSSGFCLKRLDKRWFILYVDRLEYRTDHRFEVARACGTIPLSCVKEVTVGESSSSSSSSSGPIGSGKSRFQIVCHDNKDEGAGGGVQPGRVYIMFAESDEDALAWVHSIRDLS